VECQARDSSAVLAKVDWAPSVNAVPRTPEELQEALIAIFPSFSFVADEQAPSDLVFEPPVTFHRVMLEFASFFGNGINSFSNKQLQEFAELLVRAIKEPGRLENAIDTCFLEHTRQTKVNRQLAPWLAKARAKHDA
jgi:hypothetical protein